jgi:acyl-coenzyme A thioesterase PaaI-like protein
MRLMSIDSRRVAAGILDAVPFARTLGVEFVELAPDGAGGFRVVVRLPDSAATHNHVGGPHAGAMFTLGETASGAVVLAAFGHLLDRAVPLAVRADIAYRRLAMGPVRATARLARPAADVTAEFDAGTRPEFPVLIEIGTEEGGGTGGRSAAGEGTGTGVGTVTAEMSVVWTLRHVDAHREPR